MKRTRLVCNLGLADFFVLPDSGEVWRKKGVEKTWQVIDGRRVSGYECESLYDASLEVWLPGNERVELLDNE